LASRSAESGSYDAWGIHKEAVKRQASNQAIILCTMGCPDTPCSSIATDAAAAALASPSPSSWSYVPALGLPELRSALAAAHGVPRDTVAVVPGAQAGLFTALKLLLGLEGGEVLVPTPCYSTYEATIAAAGGTPVLVQPADGDDFALRPAVRGEA
jgi:aspartate/methionine/tyrosine aminotransferase